jgi:hypothetical protein
MPYYITYNIQHIPYNIAYIYVIYRRTVIYPLDSMFWYYTVYSVQALRAFSGQHLAAQGQILSTYKSNRTLKWGSTVRRIPANAAWLYLR